MKTDVEFEVVWNGGELLPPRNSHPDSERWTTGLKLEQGDCRLLIERARRLPENTQQAGQWPRSSRNIIGGFRVNTFTKRTSKTPSQTKQQSLATSVED